MDRSDSRRWFLLFAVGGFLLHAAVLLFTPILPIMDLPNHMARHWLAAQALAGESLPLFYHIEYRPIPSLGGDLFMPFLLQVLDVEAASRLYVLLTLFLYWIGPTVFFLQQSSAGRYLAGFWSVWLFTGLFFWGFFNFTMGLGLAFLTLAHHDALPRRGRWFWAHTLLHAFLVTWLFFCHLVAWGIYGVLLCSKLAWQTFEKSPVDEEMPSGRVGKPAEWLLAVAASLPSLVLFVLYRSYASTLPGASDMEWSPIGQRLVRILLLFRGYSLGADAAALALWLAGLGLLVLPSLRELRWRWIHLGLAVLVLLLIVMPDKIGAGGELDLRLLPAILVCALAGLGDIPVRPRFVRSALVLLVLALLLRIGSVSHAWSRISTRLQQESESFTALREGDRILPVYLAPDFSKEHPEDGFITWTVIQHRAFVPNLLAYADQQPLRYDDSVLDCRKSSYQVSETGVTFDEERVCRCFDVIWVYNPLNRPVHPPRDFKNTWQGNAVSVWRRGG